MSARSYEPYTDEEVEDLRRAWINEHTHKIPLGTTLARLIVTVDHEAKSADEWMCRALANESEVKRLREALVHVRADLTEIRDTEPARRYSPSITILANTGIAVCDQALKGGGE